jgi:hypothetical protein
MTPVPLWALAAARRLLRGDLVIGDRRDVMAWAAEVRLGHLTHHEAAVECVVRAERQATAARTKGKGAA